MSDLRFDPISGLWVAIARNRLDRPSEFIPTEQTRKQLICPFCRGNEDETPLPLAAYRSDGSALSADDTPDSWTTRVVPNKFPAFAEPSNVNVECGPYDRFQMQGAQELILPSPRHICSLSELNDDELFVSFGAYQDRVRVMMANPTIKHAMLFMNCRSAAGASLGHIHTQLIGAPVVSRFLEDRAVRNQQHFDEHGTSMMQTLIDWELKAGTRIVYRSDRFIAVCPYASRFAFQTWIVPLIQQTDFVSIDHDAKNELAYICRIMVQRLEEVLEQPAYNWLLHFGPSGFQSDAEHWYFELFPRLTRPAGFELGTDIWINPVAPEQAARRMQTET